VSILRPALIPIGLAVVLVVMFALAARARRRRKLAHFLGGQRAASRLSFSNLYRLQLERGLLLAIAAFAVAAAAAEPRWIDDRPPPSPGVVFAIDVSTSMQASDAAPTRLARAVEIAQELLETTGTQRAGLVLFAGTGYVLAPPTEDLEVVRHFLNGITPTIASAHDPGSLLSVGIREAAALWEGPPRAGETRSIVLISDGESGETQETVLTEARAAAGRRIRIHTVGVGTVTGGGMMMPAAPYQMEGTVLDSDGDPAMSRLEEARLVSLAEAASGRYARADDAGALADLRAVLRPSQTPGPWWTRSDVSFVLIAVALMGLLLESLLDVHLPIRLPVITRKRSTA
jgi:Ca-activated chloride channel family protein